MNPIQNVGPSHRIACVRLFSDFDPEANLRMCSNSPFTQVYKFKPKAQLSIYEISKKGNYFPSQLYYYMGSDFMRQIFTSANKTPNIFTTRGCVLQAYFFNRKTEQNVYNFSFLFYTMDFIYPTQRCHTENSTASKG